MRVDNLIIALQEYPPDAVVKFEGGWDGEGSIAIYADERAFPHSPILARLYDDEPQST